MSDALTGQVTKDYVEAAAATFGAYTSECNGQAGPHRQSLCLANFVIHRLN